MLAFHISNIKLPNGECLPFKDDKAYSCKTVGLMELNTMLTKIQLDHSRLLRIHGAHQEGLQPMVTWSAPAVGWTELEPLDG